MKPLFLLTGATGIVLPPTVLDERKLDSIVVLPWNLCKEIVAGLVRARGWGVNFVVAVPRLEIG